MEPSAQNQRVLKNTAVLMGSQGVTWALSLLLIVFLPRYLGPEAVGKLQIATAIWTIVSMLTMFGSETMLIKEIARRPERANELVSTVIGLRLFFFLFGALAVALYIWLIGYDLDLALIFVIVGIAQPLLMISGTLQAALQGLEMMGAVSKATVASKATNTLLGLSVVILGFDIYAVAVIGIVNVLVALLIMLFALRRHVKLSPRFDLAMARSALVASSPYLLSGLVLMVYQEVDVITISTLVDHETVGWYAVSQSMMATFVFIPAIFITAVFPMIARDFTEGGNLIARVASKSINLMLLCGVPVGLGLLVIAGPLMRLLYGEAFAPSGMVLAMMGLALIAVYQTTVIGYFLTASDRQNTWTAIMVGGVIATIVLDVILVPWCHQRFGNGALGGGISFVVTETVMALIGVTLLPQGTLSWSNLHYALKVLLAGAAMVGVTWWFRELFILIPIAVGGLTYVATVALLRVVPPDDLNLLRGAVLSKLGRFGLVRRMLSAEAKG